MSLTLRNVRLVILACWSIFFAWLWLSGEVLRYLGPRTTWVVIFGAIVLSIATIAYAVVSVNGSDARTAVSWRQLAGLSALLLPVIAGVMLSNVSLGSLAASNKLASRGIDLAAVARSLASDASEISFLQVAAAGKDEQLRDTLGLQPGSQVVLTGLVMSPPASGSNQFDLGRFYITCCVADAVPISVPINPILDRDTSYPKDTWLQVTGALTRDGDRYQVDAEKIKTVAEPSQPYLSFR